LKENKRRLPRSSKWGRSQGYATIITIIPLCNVLKVDSEALKNKNNSITALSLPDRELVFSIIICNSVDYVMNLFK